MPMCKEHGYYDTDVQGLCPKCIMDIARGDKPAPGKTRSGSVPSMGSITRSTAESTMVAPFARKGSAPHSRQVQTNLPQRRAGASVHS